MVYVTCPVADAEKLAENLVESNFAACVNIIPVKSVYIWDGKLNNDNEALLLIKSVSSKSKALEQKITELHPYDVPEIVSLRADSVNESYFNWVIAQVSNPDQ